MLKKGIVFFTFLLLITSCKSTKIGDDKIANLSAKNIVKKNRKVSFQQQRIKASLNLKYIGKSELPNLKASLRIQKDSAIWISFSKLGFPVAKIMITQNRVQFYEKISRTYFDGDFTLISKSLGTDFDFNKIQNLFIGEPLLDLKEEKYAVDIQEKQYVLHPKNRNPLFDILFWIDPYHFKLTKEQIKHPSKTQSLTINYKGYSQLNNTLFPKGFHIKAVDKKRQTIIDVTYKNVIFDTKLSFPFKIPNSYKKIELK